jgi:hypothetical protein
MTQPPNSIQRFGSRSGRLRQIFLNDRLIGAKRYRRVAGYFRSSVFELVDEEIDRIDLRSHGEARKVRRIYTVNDSAAHWFQHRPRHRDGKTSPRKTSRVPAEGEDQAATLPLPDLPDILDTERYCLEQIVASLSRQPTDTKLDAVLYCLRERNWLQMGCIVFSQYYDTAFWIAEGLTRRMQGERAALYAGASKSGEFFDGEWRSVGREETSDINLTQ